MYDVDIFRHGGDTIEVFMDDFSMAGDLFERCLINLSEVLKRCEG